jgi:prophage antirepressor-like protein
MEEENQIVKLVETENGPMALFQLDGEVLNTPVYGSWDKPVFFGKEIAQFLGFQRPHEALQKHVKPKHKTTLKEVYAQSTYTSFKNKPLTYNEGKQVLIYEPGLYSLAMHSRLPRAEIFQDKVFEVILPSLRKYGQVTLQKELSESVAKLAIQEEEGVKTRTMLKKADENLERERKAREELRLAKEEAERREEQERQRADEATLRLRSETKRLKEQIKRTLEFNQATKCVEPLEYIYICTTEYYQRQHKFKVGGVQTFELLRSRLTQYNSGEADSEAHFFVYVRKTVSYRSIEQAIKGLLSGFRENQSNELYIMHYDWLIKFVDAILDGNADFAVLVNSNRQQIADDTINKEPTIVPPIQLEQIMYLRAGDTPRDLTSILDPEMRRAIQEAVDSFEPDNNTVKRKEFEDHLMRQSPNVKLDGKKRDAWEMTRALGSSKNPMWRYKY